MPGDIHDGIFRTNQITVFCETLFKIVEGGAKFLRQRLYRRVCTAVPRQTFIKFVLVLLF